MADTYKFTGKDGVQRSFVGDRPPTPEEMAGIEQAESQASPEQPPIMSTLKSLASSAKDVGVGAAKGAAHTAIDLGQAVHMIPGVSSAVDALYGLKGLSGKAFDQARDDTAYTNTSQRVGGGLETLAEMAVPVGKVAQAVPSTARAGRTFQGVMSAAKNVPVDVKDVGDVALRIQSLAERGGSMPMAVRKLLNRMTGPGGELTYEEARDFASNISRLSADEYNRLTPVVAREVANLRVTLNRAIGDAAAKVGKLSDYQAAMREYAQASKLRSVLGEVVTGAKKTLPYASGAGAGYWTAQKLRDLFTESK